MSVETIAEDLGFILPKEVLFVYWCIARGLTPIPIFLEAQKRFSLSQMNLIKSQSCASSLGVYDTLPFGVREGSTLRDWAHRVAFRSR